MYTAVILKNKDTEEARQETKKTTKNERSEIIQRKIIKGDGGSEFIDITSANKIFAYKF